MSSIADKILERLTKGPAPKAAISYAIGEGWHATESELEKLIVFGRVTEKAGLCSAIPQRVALYSIWPEYARKILTGDKTVEFRKRAPALPFSSMAIHETKKNGGAGAIVGVVEVRAVDKGNAAEIWDRWADVGGATADEYRAYFKISRWLAGFSTPAVAIQLGEVHRFAEPVPLSVVGLQRPPQSYYWLGAEQMAALWGMP